MPAPGSASSPSSAPSRPCPFAGRFRIIDFTLSNCVNSGIYDVGVLTQYLPRSLNDHIGIGRPWDLDRSRGGVRLLQPYQGRGQQQWYGGTADAVLQNLDYLRETRADTVVILSGDHIYKMDYRPMMRAHEERQADLTLAVMNVQPEETSRFGIVLTDEDGRVTGFLEKPKEAPSTLANMGVYVFNVAALIERIAGAGQGSPRPRLRQACHSQHGREPSHLHLSRSKATGSTWVR